MISSLAKSYTALPKSLRLFLVVACSLTSASLLSALIWRSLGYGLPYSAAYYFVPNDLFQDFQAFRPRFRLFGTPAFFTNFPYDFAMYPAPLLFPIAAFMRNQHPIRVFLVFTISAVLACSCMFYKAIRSTGLQAASACLFTAVTLITAYPVFFMLQRGNLEVLVWVPVMLGLVLFSRQKYLWSAALFGIATAFKLYPVIFLSLFVTRRLVRETVLSIVTACGLTLIALWKLGPSIPEAFRWNGIQLQAFGKYFAASNWALGYDHSFFALVKIFTLSHHPDLTPYVRVYTISVAAVGLLLFVSVLWRIPTLNQVVVLSVLSVTMPPVSYDYTLLTLYAALAMICMLAIKAEQSKHRVKSLYTQLVLFAIVLTPESFFIVDGARYAGQLRTVCLFASVLLALAYPLEMQTASNASRRNDTAKPARLN